MLKRLPVETELSSALGMSKRTFSYHYSGMLMSLQDRIGGPGFNPALKDRIQRAIEVWKESAHYDLYRTAGYIMTRFRKEPELARMPFLRELSSELGPSMMTFSNRYPEVLTALKNDVAGSGFDPALKKRIRQAIKKKENVHYDLKSTVNYIVGRFSGDPGLTRLPALRELSTALGPSKYFFSGHYPEILTALKDRIAGSGFDPDLKERIQKAIEEQQAIKERKETAHFDLESTLEHIVSRFEEDPRLKRLLSQTSLSSALGLSQKTYSKYYPEIVAALRGRMAGSGFDPGLKERIQRAIENRKRVYFDLNSTVDYIVSRFSGDPKLARLPVLRELSSELGPSNSAFHNHYPEIVAALKVRTAGSGLDPALKKRIRKAIRTRKESVFFDLESTVDYIVSRFIRDSKLDRLPGQKILSKALGPDQTTFSDHFSEILTALQLRIEESRFAPTLRKRIKPAIAEKMRTISPAVIPWLYGGSRSVEETETLILEEAPPHGNGSVWDLVSVCGVFGRGALDRVWHRSRPVHLSTQLSFFWPPPYI